MRDVVASTDPESPSAAALALTIFLLGAAARAGVLVATGAFGAPQPFEYEWAARNIVAGRGMCFPFLGIDYCSGVHPLFPGLLAGAYAVFGTRYEVAQVLQVLAGSLLGPALFVFVRPYVGRRAAFLAGVLAATHPPLVVFSTLKIHSETVDALVVVLSAWATMAGLSRAAWTGGALAGAGVGVAMLARGTFAGLLAAYAALAWRRHHRAAVRSTAVAVLIAGVIVTPWLLRNYALHRAPVFMLSTVPYALYIGFNPAAVGGVGVLSGAQAAIDDDRELYLRVIRERTETAQMAVAGKAAVQYIRANPLTSVRLVVQRVGMYWWFSPTAGRDYPRAWFRAYAAYYLAASFLAVIGAWTLLRRGGPPRQLALLFMAIFLTTAASQALFYVEARHRWEIESLLLVFSAVGVECSVHQLGWRRPSSPA